jgi:hypothetical protein
MPTTLPMGTGRDVVHADSVPHTDETHYPAAATAGLATLTASLP